MKKIITISVDVDTWAQAKDSKVNISSYLNECLKNVTGIPETDRKIIELQSELTLINNSLTKLYAEKASIEYLIKEREEKDALKAQELANNEKYKRWKCGACNHINFLDSIRCNGCNLPTQKDPKSEFIYIKGD